LNPLIADACLKISRRVAGAGGARAKKSNRSVEKA